MKLMVLNINLFTKYREKIEEHNTRGIYIGGFLFFAVVLVDYIVKLFVNPASINYFFAFYLASAAACLALFHFVLRKRPKGVSFMEILWYVLGFMVVFNVQLFYPDGLATLEYALVAISLSVLILIEPFLLIVGQVAGALTVGISVYMTQGGNISSFDMSKIIIVCLLAILTGMVSTYIRIEDLVFESEVAMFAGTEDDDFVAESSDTSWSGRNKYGILSGELTAKRRVFTFIFNISKGYLSHIREVNIFNLKEGMKWDKVRDQIIGATIDPLSRMRVSRFLDLDTIVQSFKAGKRRFSVIAGICVEETEKIWVDIECILKTHPVSGELLATMVVEDISEERILMAVLNRIVEQNYDYVMCVERDKNRTITFSVKPGEEIRGAYGEVYDIEVASYIRESVAEHDVERTFGLMNLDLVEEEIRKNNIHEFLIDEVDKYGNIRKKLFQYSYMDPSKNFLCVIKQDVTEVILKEDEAKARLAQALREKEAAMNARSEFMTRMSHEMRTPMNAILGLTSLMKDEIYNPDSLQDYLSKIQYSGKFLLQLINDVLDMSKMEQEKFQVNEVPYSFGEFWESIDMLIGPMCLRKGVDFEWKSSIPENHYVYTDPLRITQIFVNLLSNAVKYTPKEGHILFECKEEEEGDDNVKAFFRVKDDGIGMSEEFQRHLFEPFAQESKDINSDLNGTGLGLAIVKGILSAMGGTIEVESAPNMGTEFRVHLPFKRCADVGRSKAVNEEVDLNGKRILVVEDNDINREIAVAILQKKGVNVETAVNGLEAVEMFSSHTPRYYDLILMDIRMPVMSGLTATKRIRAMERDDASEIPIIAMTANAFSKDVQASLDAGINEHLSKPIEPKILYSTVSKFLH